MVVLIGPDSPALHFILPMKTCETITHIGRVPVPIRFNYVRAVLVNLKHSAGRAT